MYQIFPNDFLLNKAANALLDLGLQFLNSGRLVAWDSLLREQVKQNAQYIKLEKKNAAKQKGTKNSSRNGKVLRQGKRR